MQEVEQLLAHDLVVVHFAQILLQILVDLVRREVVESACSLELVLRHLGVILEKIFVIRHGARVIAAGVVWLYFWLILVSKAFIKDVLLVPVQPLD